MKLPLYLPATAGGISRALENLFEAKKAKLKLFE